MGTRPLGDGERRQVRVAQRRAVAWLAGATLGLASAGAAALAGGPHPAVSFGLALAGLASVVALAVGSLGVRLGVLAGLIVRGGVLFMATTLPESRPPHPLLIGAVEVGTVALALGFVGSRVLGALALLRRRMEIADDLRGDTAERCAGRLRDLGDARTFRVLQRRGDVLVAGQRHEVDLLPRSGFVLRVDGRPPSRPLLAPVASVAPSAPHAMRVALPADLSAIASPTVELQRRSLTPAELDELARHATSMRRPPWHLFVLAPATIAASVWQWHYTGSDEPWLGLAAVAVYVLAGAAGFQYAQRLRTSRRLRDDADLRWLVTVTERDAPRAGAPRLEMLPVSRLAWTEHASPAPWRLDGSG